MNRPRFSIPSSLKNIFGLILTLLLAGASSFAQLNSRYLKQYTEKDDLPASQVYTIMADKLGFMWIGTVNGLAKYDGYEFKRYFNNPNDTASIKGGIIWAIFEDRKGLIWISAQTEWLNVYNPVTRSFRQYDFKKLVPHPANIEIGISQIGQDKNGRIYFAISTNNGEDIGPGLLYIDEGSDSIKPYIPKNYPMLRNVFSLHCDAMGNTWFLDFDGIYKIDNKGNFTRLNKLTEAIFGSHEFFSDIKTDKNGNAWIITNGSTLWEYNPADSTFKIFTPPGSFPKTWISNKIEFDKNENLWMGTGRGLVKFNSNTHQFETFSAESLTGLEQASIRSLCFDTFGSLWMGTDQVGVLKYEERPIFKSYSHNNDDKSSMTKGWANTIIESQDGNIWNATAPSDFSGGINELNPATDKTRPVPYTTFTNGWNSFNTFYEYRPGEFFINTNNGNYIYSVSQNKTTKFVLNGIPDGVAINNFYKDSRGNLWACSLKGLFKQSKGTDTFTYYDLSTTGNGNASSNEITRAVEGKGHGLWLLTNNGLYLYNYTTDKVERHGYDKQQGDIFITQDINSLCETPDSSVWVGTWQGGLSRYRVETKKIKTYTRNDGLPSMSVQGMLYDDKDNTLWLSTFEGISRFDLATARFNNFSISDGIQSQLFADGSSLKTSRGLFAFGGSNGITVFNPNEITKHSLPPKVFLTDLKLFNKSVLPGDQSILKLPVYETKEIVLKHNQNNISLDFIALHYANPSKNKYAYKLENYDIEWREVINQHEAFYPNLPPGKYLFHVKAANNNGVWNEEGATLSIVVNPPWWKTTWAYILYALIFAALAFAVDRYFRYRVVEKERERNRTRELEQAKEIEKAYHSLEQSHETLKATQSQLIQSEKMASLGELTAGIAHEIQNPLNFVNNFSDVNKELLNEMKDEIDKGNMNEVKAIATDVIANEEKINHHGKRADSIVKGMLQHSRSSSGQKEPTDINALVDEYLRLSYHGLRAKDKSFNAAMKTDYDETIGSINIIPQDIGRVLLNLYTNAFYAVKQRADRSQGSPQYEPTVSITTKKIGIGVEIQVKDNGDGIPQNIVDKIFQPFFTTKPTGKGTGLGLSLSYDIVKAHGGTLTVKTRDGEGSVFIIQLPV